MMWLAFLLLLLQAILTAEPSHTGRVCLKSTMETLLRVARECNTFPQKATTAAAATAEAAATVAVTPASKELETGQQSTTPASASASSSTAPSQPAAVHALNILRALYRDSRLGEHIVPFIPEGVMIAIEGFSAPLWPVSVIR
jgi:cell envelope opacity-associated protein A